jgi:molybdopterin converting factor subunit 1
MRVTVLLFGRLHDVAGLRELACEVPPGATVAAVWQAVTGRFPAVAPHARSVSAAVNADFAKMTTAVEDGDEVAFLPPVAGG